jgi:hypothetical protein
MYNRTQSQWLRLCMDWIGFEKFPNFFFLKINLNILIFYITSITFYHFSNIKITTKQKISLFYTKYFYFFPHINQICYSINQLLPIQSISKHSQYKQQQKGVLEKNVNINQNYNFDKNYFLHVLPNTFGILKSNNFKNTI